MRVYAVSNSLNNCCAEKKPLKREINYHYNEHCNEPLARDSVSFKGYKIHIIDNGAHADNMTHFARGIVKGIGDVVDVLLYRAETNPHYSGMKQIGSVKEKLEFLNRENIAKPGDFIALPLSSQVSLNTLAQAMGLKAKTITPENLKSFKPKILEFLQYLETAPYTFGMDPNRQGIQHVYGTIGQINELIKKGVHVYLPASHPIEGALKARAAEEGVKDDLYKYIYTRGKEGWDSINPLIKELKEENAYRFNLLALSDAHVVNVRDLTGQQNYIFAAYDSCVNDGARGVFNFYPVRNKEGEIIGYSYTDKYTVHYPVHEFPANDEFANIAKFVGKNVSDCIDTPVHHKMLQRLIDWEEPHDDFPDLLYSVADIYTPKRLREENLLENGRLVDKSEKLFFDYNDSHEVIFRKTDCEGSGRPSVLPMWGSCFATINAIKRDITKLINSKRPAFGMDIMNEVDRYYDLADAAARTSSDLASESYLNKALNLLKPYKDDVNALGSFKKIYSGLYTILMRQEKFGPAEAMANAMINTESRLMRAMFRKHYLISDYFEMMNPGYWDVPTADVEAFLAQSKKIGNWYRKVEQLCSKKGNYEAAKMCEWAANIFSVDYRKNTSYVAEAANDILERRASGILNIRDIYNDNYKRCEFEY